MATVEVLPLEIVDRIGGAVDQVGAEERAASLSRRSIKKDSKVWALDLAIRCCDLTTLEGSDSPGKVRQLASKAIRPAPGDPSIPHVAALCVYPNLVPTAVEALRGSLVAMAAGADTIKTSTGKVSPASTLPVALIMSEAIRDFEQYGGRAVGLKVAGGIRTAKDAIRYPVIVHETLGADWLTPDRFRIGASSLLNDLLMQIDFQRSGFYSDPDRYTLD